MAENSKIGWTDHTQNFWWGCDKVSQECKFCYISGIMRRGGFEPFNGPMRTKNWANPLRWNRAAKRESRRARVFTCSMSDFFHEGADKWRDEAWQVISQCRYLDWLILTKRDDRIAECLPEDWRDGYPNVWLGVTAGCKLSLSRVETLLTIPAVVRFISAEPLLERIDLRPFLFGIDWVITGCERARKGERRIMDLDWVRDIDSQCRAAGVAHFFKQYYIDDSGVPCEDGVLDNVRRQAWPTPLETPAFAEGVASGSREAVLAVS
jgi:protein gp37